MGDFLIVSLAEELQAYEDLAQEYQVGFEINDFYDPLVFEDKKRREDIIQKYQKAGIPAGSTMHGAFYDVSVFSYDPQIREISKLRMRQSMEIAQELSVKGVVFHTNWNPMLSNIVYDDQVVDGTCTFVRELLEAYPEIQIYMEICLTAIRLFYRKYPSSYAYILISEYVWTMHMRIYRIRRSRNGSKHCGNIFDISI